MEHRGNDCAAELRVLWLESGDLYTVRRGKEAGSALGMIIDSVDLVDLCFTADGTGAISSPDACDLSASYDAVIMRSFMPFVSEALTIARVFRDAGKVVVDASLTDEGYAMSKMHDYLLLARAGLPVPRTCQCYSLDQAEAFADSLGYPVVLKGVHGAEGRAVFKVNAPPLLRRRILRHRPGELMVQEYLPADHDYRVMVVGYKALPVMVQRKPRAGEFRTNFDFNEEVTPLATDDFPAMRDVAQNAARLLRREFSGVDIRFRGEQPVILEANRRPGFMGFEKATSFDVAGEFIRYVRHRCVHQRHRLTGPLPAGFSQQPPQQPV